MSKLFPAIILAAAIIIGLVGLVMVASNPSPSPQQPASLQKPNPLPEVKQPAEVAQDQQKVPEQQSQAQQKNVAPPRPQQVAQPQVPPIKAEANKSTVVLPVFDKLNASTIDNSIGFTVKLNSTLLERGQVLNGNIMVRNLQPEVVNLTVNGPRSQWAPVFKEGLLERGGCTLWSSNRIFKGYYTESNISSATPLQMLNPAAGLDPSCPLFAAPEVYKDFYIERAPDGDIKAIYLVLQPHGEKFGAFYMRGYYVKSECYMRGGYEYCDLVPFPPGVYTVAVGTAWGQMLILHFSVK